MTFSRPEEMLFALLRHAINNVPLPEDLFAKVSGEDWRDCHAIAAKQGVMAIVWDAVMSLPAEFQPPKPLKIKWGLAVENYSGTYRRYCKTIHDISEFYSSHGIRTVQLKGVGLSSYYPVPERRQGGDIDIYTYSADKGKMSDKDANELADRLMRDQGIDVEMHSYKHSFFYYGGIPVENHKFFLNVEHYAAAAEAEKLLHRHFNPRKVTLAGEYGIMIPSPEFNSLFVCVHALQHFTSGLALHHLCDWACVLKQTGQELPLSIEDGHFTAAVRALTQLCRKYIGTDIEKEDGLDDVCDTIMQEILYPKYHAGQMPHNPIGILWYKTRRFAYSARLRGKVWNISMAKAVWQSIIGHLKEPETILMRGE